MVAFLEFSTTLYLFHFKLLFSRKFPKGHTCHITISAKRKFNILHKYISSKFTVFSQVLVGDWGRVYTSLWTFYCACVFLLGPDYMRPVWTQTDATSERSSYRGLFMLTWSQSEKSCHASFTHSGCWTDTNDLDRSEVEQRNHVNTNWFETGQRSLFWPCAIVLLDHSKLADNRKESKENPTHSDF